MITPNTDPDALEKALRPFANEASELAVGIPDDCRLSYDGFPQIGLSDFTVGDLRRAKEALAAEKRRAREGVTDAVVDAALDVYFSYDVIWREMESPSALQHYMRAALEAVWPDGRDAKDAARYRWLREGDNDDRVFQRSGDDWDDVFLPRKERLDAAIDAAMNGGDDA